ncbi:MAG TPA: hypothetical protein DCY13_03935 [Verrucomicrobiales bacterium]|nr:hypothetical protein [Verrucomicrobiales bacterium]
MIALLLVGHAAWMSLPAQRLQWIAQAELPSATNIRVTGVTGITMMEWVAVCQIDETAFLDYCREGGLKVEEKIEILKQVRQGSLVKHVEWVAGLPDFADTLQFRRHFDDRPFNGLFVLYDRSSGTMLLHLRNG